MINLYNVYSRSRKIVARDTGDEYVLVPVTDNIADMKSVYTLNSTGAFIWDRIDGTRTVKDIVDEVEEEFDVDGKQALDDVLSFFSDMKEYLIIVE
ncbi:MAG: PqqD family protein [Bacteroidota bacterium]